MELAAWDELVINVILAVLVRTEVVVVDVVRAVKRLVDARFVALGDCVVIFDASIVVGLEVIVVNAVSVVVIGMVAAVVSFGGAVRMVAVFVKVVVNDFGVAVGMPFIGDALVDAVDVEPVADAGRFVVANQLVAVIGALVTGISIAPKVVIIFVWMLVVIRVIVEIEKIVSSVVVVEL